MTPAVFVPVAAAVLAPIVSYLVAARKMSGKIGTSDAEVLWRESTALRADIQSQLAAANLRMIDLEKRVSEAEAKLADKARENWQLTMKVRDLETRLAERLP